MHIYEECAITGKSRCLYDECHSFFERYDEEEAELFCSYLLLLLVPQMHLSYTKMLILSFNKSVSLIQNTVWGTLVNVWK